MGIILKTGKRDARGGGAWGFLKHDNGDIYDQKGDKAGCPCPLLSTSSAIPH